MNNNYWEIPENKLALEITNLNKYYNEDNKNFALNNVSLNIPKGTYRKIKSLNIKTIYQQEYTRYNEI